MFLATETISVLAAIPIDGTSMLEFVYRGHDSTNGTWSYEAVTRVEAAMLTAARRIPVKRLIGEFYDLADFHACDRIESWDSDAPQLELEMFLDHVLEAIEQEMCTR